MISEISLLNPNFKFISTDSVFMLQRILDTVNLNRNLTNMVVRLQNLISSLFSRLQLTKQLPLSQIYIFS